MTASAIEAVAFDVNQTLFTLDRLRPAFTNAGLDPTLAPVWFARLLRDGFALAALGGYRTFSDVAAETPRGLNTTVNDDAVATVVAAMRELDPHWSGSHTDGRGGPPSLPKRPPPTTGL